MRACYELIEVFQGITNNEAKVSVTTALAEIFPDLLPHNARMRVLGMFDDAMEQVGLISHLDDTEVSDLLRQINEMQGDALMALAQENVGGFKAKAKVPGTIQTLRLIGHSVAAIQLPQTPNLDREGLEGDIRKWLDVVDKMDINPVPKAVLEIKLRSLLRFLIESKGATTNEILRRLKSVADDLAVELKEVSESNRSTIAKLREAIMAPVKNTAYAVNLASSTLTVASVLGPAAIALLPLNEPVRALPAPERTETTDASAG